MKSTKILYSLSAALLSATGLVSCLNNDIPNPRIVAGFTAMTAEGEIAAAAIDNVSRIVTLSVGESVDLAEVKITDYELTEGASLSADITDGLDLTKDYRVTVSLYQNYEWVIRANQTIERRFSVPGQVGSSVIDPAGKRVIIYMLEGTDMSSVATGDVKLGPADITTMEPDLNNTTCDFTEPVSVKVTYNGLTEEWTVYAFDRPPVLIDRVDVWTNVMWVYGSVQDGSDFGIEYRLNGDEAWTQLEPEAVTVAGGEFTACISHVEANAAYEVRAYSNNYYTESAPAVTEEVVELPDMGFDHWWFQDGKIWNPWAEGGESFWDTGNDGATTLGLGESNSVPVEDTWNGEAGYSAKLTTEWRLIKVAGGNIFAGSYVRTAGMDGVLSFGREFTGRPTRLRGHWKYTSTTISDSFEDSFDFLIGRPDTAIIYTALINKPEPIEIRTNKNERQLFDRNADYVVAYGQVQTGESIDGWTEFEIEYEYRRTDVKPTYIVIVCTSSKYADYYVGGRGSTLWVDDFSLDWDK